MLICIGVGNKFLCVSLVDGSFVVSRSCSLLMGELYIMVALDMKFKKTDLVFEMATKGFITLLSSDFLEGRNQRSVCAD